MDNEGFVHTDDQTTDYGTVRATHEVAFSWQNLTIKVKSNRGEGDRTILHEASGLLRPGELVAIMGASGAGKSTLLNALTFRNMDDSNLEVLSGTRYANGVPVSPTSLTAVSAYIQQEDLFIGTLTVAETLEFHSRVRMDPDLTAAARKVRITEVAEQLDLRKCLQTLVGEPGRIKGISGGERKRLAIACEVLTNPSLLFCDEPTSGLDAFMARSVVRVLRDLSRQHKTILCTIHQPSSQVFELFDKVLLMAEGRMAYQGCLQDAHTFFREVGYPCPENYNPADHYIEVLAFEHGKEAECRERVDKICAAFRNSHTYVDLIEAIDREKNCETSEINLYHSGSRGTRLKRRRPVYKASWLKQWVALMKRSWLSQMREPRLIKVRVFQSILIAIIMGTVFLRQEISQSGVQNINAAIFLVINNLTFENIYMVITVLCSEYPVFFREHFNGMYRVDTYYLSKQLIAMPLYLVVGLLYLIIFYWMAGLYPGGQAFGVACLCSALVTQTVVGFGSMVSSLGGGLGVSMAMAAPMILPFFVLGGYFVNTRSVPQGLIWLEYLSWFRYSDEILLINQWQHIQDIPCPPANITACHFPDGDAVISFMGFTEDNLWFDWMMLAVLALGFHVVAFIVLLLRSYRARR